MFYFATDLFYLESAPTYPPVHRKKSNAPDEKFSYAGAITGIMLPVNSAGSYTKSHLLSAAA